MVEIRKVEPSEAGKISEIAIRSKAYWGYDKAFMDSCREELSHTEEEILNDDFRYFLAEKEGEVMGFYKLENLDSETVLLEALFVDTLAIGHGVGRSLFEHAKATAKACGGSAMEAQSDPYAKPFYLAMGAKVTGNKESGSIPGRFLPMIEVALEDAA
ncbi:GNAT family N-acetyltransferase [Alteromonadaceae bacterium M269]|nr:GNAT family N-acetyltransferase [Alteromonadaceae bacterium M269]